MRIFYKCLTAVLVALVTCFSASAIRVDIDNPEAVTVKIFNNNNSTQITLSDLSSGVNNLPYDYPGMIIIKEVSPWVIDSATGPAGELQTFTGWGPFNGSKTYEFAANSNDLFTIRTSNPEAQQGPNVTIDIDNPEAVVVEMLDYTVGTGTWQQIPLTENLTTIPWGDYGQVRAKAADGWEILNFEGYAFTNTDPDDETVTWYNSYPGQDVNWTITTKQAAAEPTFLTLTLDNPEAVTFFGYYNDADGTEIPTNFVNGECKIGTTEGGILMMRPNPGYKVVSAPGFIDQSADTGMWGLQFEAGDTNTYAITTAADTQSTFITLNLDNPGAVTVEVMDIELQTIQPQDGVYKIDTATAGTIYVNAVDPWHITSIDGLDGAAPMTLQDNGSYTLDFQAGQTGNYAISTIQPSTVTIEIDNPEAITAKLTYDYQNFDTLVLQAGENSFPVTSWGSVQITPNSPWVIETYEGANLQDGIYYVNVDPQSNKSCKFTTSQPVVEPTYITLNVDNPEALAAVFVSYADEEGSTEQPTIVKGENKFATTYDGQLIIYPNDEEWTILTHDGLQEMFDLGHTYGAMFEAGATTVYTITSEPKSAATYITVNIDNPEAVTAKVVYSDDTINDNPTLTDGAYKIDTTKGGTLQVKAKSPWTIVSAEGFNHVLGYYNLDFTAGAEDTYSITTHNPESGAPTHITLTVDHPEAVTVTLTYTDKEAQTIEAVDGVYTIDTTTEGGRFDIAPVSPWEIVDAGSLLAHWKYVGQYYTTFDAGAENTYNVTTNYTDAPEKTYSTLIIDNPEAVMMAQVEYSDETPNLELDLVAGENRFETTSGGTLVIAPNTEWTILTYENLQPMESMFGLMYGAEFEAGATNVYTITSVKTSEASKLKLNIDNPEGVTVQLSYEGEDAQEIELQEGDNEILTIKGGDIMLTLKENWTLTSAPDFNQIPGTAKYLMHFDAGDTQTYTVSVNNEASVDSILGDEVIETAVFNMQGIKVADSTDNLAAGMYIIAGKKVVVK